MYKVLIRNNSTKEIREHIESGDWDFESSEYLWTEGNYSCDCNRGLFFNRTDKNFDEKKYEHLCGQEKYNVIKIILDDREIVIDGE